MSTVTRFAPSPTGLLHIGGARTALFNWLFAKKHGGKFILRIDDTDRERSTEEATAAILSGLQWLGIRWDDGPFYQHQLLARHMAVAQEMLAKGLAYKCFATQDDLTAMRAAAVAANRPPRYDGRWRDRPESDAPAGAPYVIRLKAPQNGETVIEDMILGSVTFRNAELDDFILLRADGSPTYMLSTVVDDHDLGVTHVIRGNEHLPNAARQLQLIRALGWAEPTYAHIPLIHGVDGTKLSKRHGAVGVEYYRDMGFLPDAMCDYLMRLGWAPGAEHPHLTKDQAAPLFDLSHVSKGPARFDLDALTSANFHFIKEAEPAYLADVARPFFEKELSRSLSDAERDLLVKALPGLKERAKTLPHLAESGAFYFRSRPIPMEEAAQALLDIDAKERLRLVRAKLGELADWSHDPIAAAIKAAVGELGVKFPAVGLPLRAALTGRTNSPGVADVLDLLGRDEALARLDEALS
ncbi:glutamate--tRNA ligase [Lacibacterium aquatile]|uniref:Glutamate--tRNA ligase n=1 Tax=Lacibacterium aquatile TaxID=1168082 RepID=A0ABW5DXI1_9PROT